MAGRGIEPLEIAGRTSVYNPMAEKSTIDQIKSYFKSDEGAGTLAKFPKTIMDFTAEVARITGRPASADTLDRISKGFGSTTKGLFYASWFVGSIELAEQASKVAGEGVGDGRFVELTRRSFKWVSTSCESVVPYFLPGIKSSLKDVKTVAELVADSIGAYQSGDGWSTADLEAGRADISAQVQAHLKAEKGLHLISLVKSVASVVAGIFGIIGLFLGFAIVPSIVLLTISVVTSTLSIVKHFYKENMDYKPLADWKKVEVLA